MGAVYLARDNKLGRRVAIKVLLARDADLTRRFITEARATARCTHESIVVIHEVGEHRGDPFMVLVFIEGQSLAALRGPEPMAISRAVELMVSVVRALVRAHDEGIVHRDLKPENVLLASSGSVKVLDFGIAKLLQTDALTPALLQPEQRVSSVNVSQARPVEWTPHSGVSGTIPYMSPEQWGVGGDIDHRTDIWAVGITLFELLAARYPFGENAANVTRLDSPTPSLAEAAPWVPAELTTIVDRCLRKDKEERFSDARELLKALERFVPGHLQAGAIRIESGPYAGLRAFQEEDAGRFFGRTQELAALRRRIHETVSSSDAARLGFPHPLERTACEALSLPGPRGGSHRGVGSQASAPLSHWAAETCTRASTGLVARSERERGTRLELANTVLRLANGAHDQLILR